MSELPFQPTSTETLLEAMTPKELRRYALLWVDEPLNLDRFIEKAYECQSIALAQIEAVGVSSPELMEWIRTLETLDMSIEFAEAARMAEEFGCTPPREEDFLD